MRTNRVRAMSPDDYLAGWEATRRVKDADGYTLADLAAAARFTAANEYVRQADTMVTFESPDFSQGGGALLVYPDAVDTDAGMRGSIGTADGRVVFTEDTTVTVTVYRIADRKPEQVTYVIPGTLTRKRRSTSKATKAAADKKRVGATAMTAAERKRRQRAKARATLGTVTEARAILPNLTRLAQEADGA